MKRKHFLLHYINKYKWKYLLGIITLFIVDLFNLFIPQLTGEITDGLQSHTIDMNGVISIVVKIVMIGIIITIGRFFWRYFIFGSARSIELEIRNNMFKHLEGLSTRYYNNNKTGDLMAHFTNDMGAIRMSIGPAVVTSFDATIMTVMVLIKMITHIDMKLTLIAVIPLFFIAFGGILYGKAAEARFEAKQQAFSDLTDQVQESISGVRVIKAFVQERKELKAFAIANKNNMDKNMRVVKLQAIVMPLLDVIIGVSSLITLLYGGYLAIVGEITLGKFIAFNQYIGMLVWPMIAAGESITLFSQGRASLNRIKDIFNEQSDVVDSQTVKDIGSIEGEIEFKDLTFLYPGSNLPALQKVSVKIASGSTLAILGRTGSGKTTFASLLLHLYNTNHNSIYIDGNDISDIPLRTLRESIAYVPQDNFLFSDTLHNNISFGANTKDIELVHEASKLACIHDNIMDFPKNYETMVGERGVTLSGGQKQRSSLARALMKNAPILILDDALSAVDTDTEEKILSNLKQNRSNKTTIIIAHRISTIQNADHILVLDDGNVVEYGTHEYLLSLKGTYATMYDTQQLEKQLENE